MLRLAALLAGIALFVWRVWSAGVDDVAAGVASVHAGGFALILGCSFLRFAARAGAWVALLGGRAPYARALAATIAGDAAGNLTPLGPLVGEPAKAAYVTSADLRTSGALAALAAENFFYSISVAIYVVVGAAAMLQAFAVDAAVRAMGFVVLGGMAAVLAGAAWLAWRQPSVLSGLLDRLPVARARALVERVREFELTSYGSVGGHTGSLLRVVALHVFFHALSYLEMWLTLWLLTGESLPGAALVLDSFGRVANIAFKVVPLQIGVHQLGSEIIAVAIGLDAADGLNSSLVRTARVLVWSACGLALLGARRAAQPAADRRT